MKLAFCLFRYFPYGGLQRDFRRIAEVCLERGHEINVFTGSWEGDRPPGFNISIIRPRGLANHRQSWNFSVTANEYLLKEKPVLVTGFNKMHGLDIYYSADPCFKAKLEERKNRIIHLLPRYRTYLALEQAVFDKQGLTRIMLISDAEKPKYIKHYGTPSSRFHLLPPGISKDRIIKDVDGQIRKEVCSELDIDCKSFLLLMVGSAFKTKGLDRAIKALSSLPQHIKQKTVLLVIGKDNPAPFRQIADKLNVSTQLRFTGGREDVPRFMSASDLLLHPAYTENTGTVLLEAMTAGLPVIATDICGYAFHVKKAGAGLLIPSPFRQQDFNKILAYMITSDESQKWRDNGLRYISVTDVFSMPEKAADIIETYALEKAARI